MEVHHHAHTSRKKWTHYFWEFLMLFLAVFCGFLAEYQLEHKIEKDREKQYIYNLLEDLRADTAIYAGSARHNLTVFGLIDTLIKLMKNPERKNHVGKLAFTARMILPAWKEVFPADHTYEDMKSSGHLRLIRKRKVADNISYYYNSASELRKYNEAAMIWGTNYGSTMGKIFDGELLLKILKEKKEQEASPSDLLTEDRVVFNELITSAQYLYGAIKLGENVCSKRNLAAQNLIELIKKEYHLK